jgi:pimeloyl-ACP methyl ester carboxylesterase
MPEFHAHPQPVTDYTDAVARINAKQASEVATPGFRPDLKSILLTHGHKTRRAVLWLHGYTAATREFAALAQQTFEKGYNTFVPCAPHHGFKDRLSPELSRVKAGELVRYTDEMVDLMHGLGDEIIVGGLSMGGAMTAWAAQERPDVAVAIMVAPFLGARIVPDSLIRPVAILTQYLPDILQWWDPVKKEKIEGGDYGYFKRSFHSLGQILKIGSYVFSQASRLPPKAGQVWMVTNAHDDAVSNPMADRLVATWRSSGAKNVAAFCFPDELGLPHGCISADEPKGRPELVYTELMKMVG